MTQNGHRPQTQVPATRRTPAAVRVFAKVTLAAVAVQFALAGLGAFDAVHGDTVKDSFFTLHDRFALVVIALTVATLIAALVARAGAEIGAEAAGLAVLAGPAQHYLATAGADHAPWVGSLHVVNGLIILYLATRLAYPGIRSARRRRAAEGDPI